MTAASPRMSRCHAIIDKVVDYAKGDPTRKRPLSPREQRALHRGNRGSVRHQVRLCLNKALLLKVALYCSKLLISRTQSSSFPGPAPSRCSSVSASAMDDRLIQGTGNGDACTFTDSPGWSTCDVRPSIETPAGARLRSPIRKVMTDDDGNTRGRKDKLLGHIGVSTSALNDGCTIGPPAERE